ncbi:MAG: hypothetical protein IJB65_06255 [Clostridia bacterium]|nr:hypothetical protein [Clostridia bacterium]
MKNKRLLQLIGDIDDSHINEAEPVKRSMPKFWKYASIAACACITVAVCLLLIGGDRKTPPNDETLSAPAVSTEDGMLSPFAATPPSDGEDWFAEDELRHVEIILQGNMVYTQLGETECRAFVKDGRLDAAAYGEKLGAVKEIGAWDKADNSPCSQEPNLRGCDVFWYAPIDCQGLIIVEGNGHRNLFEFCGFSEEGHSIAEVLEVKGAHSAEDVELLSYITQVPTGTLMEVQKASIVTDYEEIAAVTEIITKLKPYIRESNLSGDPDWLCDAREEYKKLDKKQQTAIQVKLSLKNGLAVSFEYQPNLGSGYIQGNYFLSNEDNAKLKEIFE